MVRGDLIARFNGGWVKIHRKAILGDIGSNFTRSGLFTTLIGIANIQESHVSWRGLPRKLERGEIVTSVTELASLGETDRRTVDRHLNYLVVRETITIEKSPNGTLIKILNFDKYQQHDAAQVKRQRNDRSNDTLNDVAHIEEVKKKRKKEEASHPFYSHFLILIKEYPVKVPASKIAFKRFTDHVKSEADFQRVMLHLANYKIHLKNNPWKAPRQTIDTFFGSEQKGYFWLDFESADIGELKNASGSTNQDIVEW